MQVVSKKDGAVYHKVLRSNSDAPAARNTALPYGKPKRPRLSL